MDVIDIVQAVAERCSCIRTRILLTTLDKRTYVTFAEMRKRLIQNHIKQRLDLHVRDRLFRMSTKTTSFNSWYADTIVLKKTDIVIFRRWSTCFSPCTIHVHRLYHAELVSTEPCGHLLLELHCDGYRSFMKDFTGEAVGRVNVSALVPAGVGRAILQMFSSPPLDHELNVMSLKNAMS